MYVIINFTEKARGWAVNLMRTKPVYFASLSKASQN